MKRILRTRTATHADYAESPLRRCLSAFDLTLLGVGGIIGTGIFVLTGHAAATLAGPAVILSFVVAGFACVFAALCYAELAATVGGCGSAYGYSYAALGEIFAWLIGWTLVLEYAITVAAVANGWSGYFGDALHAAGIFLPDLLTHAPKQGGIVNLPAVVIVLLLMGLLIVGVKASVRTNALMVAVKLATIAIFLFVASFNVHPENWSNFLPFGWFEHAPDGKPVGVFPGAALIFFAYIGFDAVSTAAEECKNPQRDLPIGIIASLGFCTVIYILVSGLLTLMVPYTELNVSSPVSHALTLVEGPFSARVDGFCQSVMPTFAQCKAIGLLVTRGAPGLVAIGVIAGLTTVMLVNYYALTRIIYAMGRDGLIPAFFGAVSEKTQTPVRVILLCGAFMAVVAGLVPLGDLAELVNIGTLSAFVMVCLGVMVLRYRQPDLHRPFVTPFYPFFPLCGAASCAALMLFLPDVTWFRFLGWLVLGLAIYFGYSIRNSHLHRTAAP
jgi:APA family basic amino acid/polyamine antiporter